jgi:hypothetical protein
MTRGSMKINMKAFEDRKEIKRHKINDGVNVFRILPPFGENADGYPYRRWSICWLADPTTGRNRPYASPWSFGEKECPVGEYTKLIQDKKESLEKKLSSQDLSKEEMKEALKPLTEVLWKVKPKATFFFNAVNKSGEVGVLEIKKSAQDELKKVMKEYISDYNQDPTSLNSDQDDSGVWFKMTKTGQLMSTEYKVEKNQIKAKNEAGKLVFLDDQEALPGHVVANYESLATDLFTLYKQVSYEDLKDVLLHNLSVMHAGFVKEFGKKSADLLKVPGFEFDQVEEQVEEQVKEDVPVVKTKPVVQQTAPKKVMPKFDDDEDTPVIKAKPKPVPAYEDEEEELPRKPAPKKARFTDEDMFAAADDILNS